MTRYLPLLILALPFLEIAAFIEVGGMIGTWPTLGLVVASMFLGLRLLRARGLSALTPRRQAPGDIADLLDRALVTLAGIFLVIPGLITDAVGLLLLIKPLRGWLAAGLLAQIAESGSLHFYRGGRRDWQWPPQNPTEDPTIIEGEFTPLDEEAPPRPPKGRLER